MVREQERFRILDRPMRLPYELYLALRYLRFHRGRTFLSVITLISIAGVMVGTAALVIALSLMAGFMQDVRERIHSGSAHLTVLSLEDDTFEGAEALIRQTESVAGVQAAGAVLYSPAMLMLESSTPPPGPRSTVSTRRSTRE